MGSFGAKSAERLATCHPGLQNLFNEVVKSYPYDCSILTGHRGKEEQDKAVAEGRSKTPWPTGNHNAMPSNAVDACPSPYQFPEEEDRKKALAGDKEALARYVIATGALYHMAGYIMRVSQDQGLKTRWGGAWDGKLNKPGQFMDLDHWEIPKA